MNQILHIADDSFQELLPEVISIAEDAGREIMHVYREYSSDNASYKEDGSPLTEADLRAHELIVRRLAQLTPEYPILSEESEQIVYKLRKNWKRFWLVDPLDGTKEFVKRNGEFTVNIALIENGVPILGVVYAPVLDVCYYGAREAGAFKISGSSEAQPIAAKQHMTGETIRVVASRSHSDERTQALLDKLGGHECISMGSSLKLCLVAEGVAHFYPRLGPTMEWDTAAAHAIVSAAGGVVHSRNGKPLTYNKPDLHNSEFFVYALSEKAIPQMIKELNEQN